MEQGGGVDNDYNNEDANDNINVNGSQMRVASYPSVSTITTGTSTTIDNPISMDDVQQQQQQQSQIDQVQSKAGYIYIMALHGNLPIDYKGVVDAIRSLPNEKVLKTATKMYLKIGKDLESVLIEQKKYLEYLIEKNSKMKEMFSGLFKKEKDRRRRIRNKKIQKQKINNQ